MNSYKDFLTIDINENVDSINFSFFRFFYTPIIASNSINLYSLLFDIYKINPRKIQKLPVHKIAAYANMDLIELNNARRRLEAVGLIRTFFSQLENSYVVTVLAPLSPMAYLKNKILTRKLTNAIGELAFEELVSWHAVVPVSKNEHQEITAKYFDVFEIPQSHSYENENWENFDLEKAIATLEPKDYYRYLTKNFPFKKMLDTFNELSFLRKNALNEILYYSFIKNDGKIIPNHVKTVGQDLFFHRKLKTQNEIHEYLRTLINKNNNYQKQQKIDNQFTKNISTAKFNKKSNQLIRDQEDVNVYDLLLELKNL